MSTNTHVFFRGKLPSKAALNRAMKELGFPFSIKPASGSLEGESGFMPMRLRGEETGVELHIADDLAAEELRIAGVSGDFQRCASFRWSSDFQEAVAGMCAAAALAKLLNGVVFDEAEGKVLTVDGAVEVAKKNLQLLLKGVRQRKPSGPTLLKRMLAPLLERRNDLLLVYPLLLIQPIRHLIRGAEFRWRDGGTICSVGPYIRPLCQPSQLFMGFPVFEAPIHDSDFAPMLFDRLAKEIFEPLGKITTIEDLIASSWGERMWASELFHSILLARGIEQAKAYIAPFERSSEKFLAEARERLAAADRRDRELMFHRKYEFKEAEESIAEDKARQAFLAEGDSAVFAHYRKWEAKVARGYKIEHVWQPSPFPVELREWERSAKSADPTLRPTPWLDFTHP
jgi:hypothetical protein